MTGALAMGTNKITGLGTPTISTDAATKSYVDTFVALTANITDLNVTTAKLAADAVTNAKLADDAVQVENILNGSITVAKMDGAAVVTAAEQAAATANDTSFFTTSATDARFFRQDTSETIASSQPWSSSDSFIATTAAIDARVIDLVDDVGGFFPITNETSFPAANPDINDGAGTIVSIKEMVTSRTPTTGTVSISNGQGSNTVIITGCGTTVLAAGFGVLVETTATFNTYSFHRLVPKATEVTTVAGISADITTVANNSANVTTVADDLNEPVSEINTVAVDIANVNAVGGSIANVNTVATNLASVNIFANQYRVAASDPTTSLDTGDLVFNTTNNELRVYNGSAWQGGVTATGNLISKSGDTFTGPVGITLGTVLLPGLFFSGDPNTGLFSTGADNLSVTTGGVLAISVSNGQNVTFANNVILDNQADARFREATANGTNYVGFQAPASVAADVLWTLPGVDGVSGQILSTNGSGTLSWAAASSVIVESQQVIGADYTLTAGYNGMSAGPVEVTATFTVTVPANATWVIL
jgi:hypothetical protein